jgi:hypothetical protein
MLMLLQVGCTATVSGCLWIVKRVQHHVMQKFGDVIQLEPVLSMTGSAPFLTRKANTGSGIEHNRVLAVAAGLEQRLLDFPPFGIRLFRKALYFQMVVRSTARR